MRWIASAVLVCAVCVVGPARAADLLFFDSQPGDYIGQGIPQRFTPSDGTFNATRKLDNGVSSVSIGVSAGARGAWSLDFAAPLGAELAAGTYEGATRFPFQAASVPGLSVSGDGRGCNTLTGRFVVLEATYGPGGEVQSFAADFEQHCEGGVPALFGSIRFHVGDAACAGGPGTPCEDRDACTATSTCQTSTCTGAGEAPCSSSDQCRAAACNPADGACVTRAQPDFSFCDDGDACTLADSCQNGVCTGGGTGGLLCYDGDPCTADLCHDSTCDFSQPTVCPDDADVCTTPYCDPAFGCTFRAVTDCCHTDADCDDGNICTEDVCGADHRCTNDPVPCWDLMGKVTATASANGRTASQTRRFRGVLILKDDGTYRVPAGVCPNTGQPLPDEIGTTQPGRRGRLLLKADNLDEVYAALDDCVGQHVRVVSYRAWVKILADRQHLRGASTLVARTRVNGVAVSIRAIERFRGTKVAGGLLAHGTPRASPAYLITTIPLSVR